MKLLFVCRANVGRSQAAMSLYNLSHPGVADSAGTIVDSPGMKLKEHPGAVNIIEAVNVYGVDMSENVRTQVTEDMLQKYDLVAVMAEPEVIPNWLRDAPNVEIWEIADPKGESIARTNEIVAQIKARIDALDAQFVLPKTDNH